VKTWKEAIIKVLAESATPLHYMEITEQILSRGYYETTGATPAATVNSVLTTSIKEEGERSPFISYGGGLYGLRKNLAASVEVSASTKSESPIEALAESEVALSQSLIRSFGMYWRRDFVVWHDNPKLYGKQLADSREVDFGKQKGIYILHDDHTVVYVGRCTRGSLVSRLYSHTRDRLFSRWNRFSWFGLLDVTDEGGLLEGVVNFSLAALIVTLESLLIEVLEPPKNRKSGDYFYAIEYIQHKDPRLEDPKLQQLKFESL